MTFEVENGCFGYQQGNDILQNIEFQVSSGMVMAILGPTERERRRCSNA